ncbi:MAG: translation elongation factor Ts [Alphaproteobacteria bacterium]
MAQITASLVKDLREKTGAGMMDCKKALSETDGNVEAAVDWLRKSGLAAAAKKASRVAAEGLVAVNASGNVGAAIEVNAETDFVSRNSEFQSFVSTVAGIALDKGEDTDAILNADFGNGSTVQDTLTSLISTIGENMNLRRAQSLSVSSGVVSSYVHNATAPGLGRIAVLVALESKGDVAVLEGVGKQLAMHVAAASPRWATVDEVDQAELERERTILTDQAKDSGKPEEIIAKMVEGRLRKFYEETVLLEQVSVIDGESKISKTLEQAGQDAGAPVTLKGFVRYVLGEGVEKDESDFAAEVAAAVQG